MFSAVADSPGAQPPEEERWLRPSRRLAYMRRIELCSVALPVAAAGGALGGVLGAPDVGAAVGVALLVVAAVADRFLARRVASWGYAERADDLLVRRGVLFRRLSVIPYGRMQFIDVTAGPFERLFGLATVRMHTAAAASDARIPGLEQKDAARVRDRLATLGEAQASGL